MTWAKLDDQYFRHPKSRAAGKDGRALDLAAICYSSSALTDGFVSKAALPLIAAEAEVRPAVVRRLVECGRWEEVIGGWQIHNYVKRQRSRDEVEGEREATRDRVKKHRDKRKGNGVTSPVSNGVSNGRVTASEVEVDTDLTQSVITHSEPPCGKPAVDDDRISIEEQPLDPTAITIRAVLERCADHRMRGKPITNRAAYRTTVLAELEHEHGDELRKLIARFDAPVDVLAGRILGEDNGVTLARYRRTEPA